MVDNPNFRELLIYIGGGICTEEDIPHRTKLTSDIIEAWKEERKVFAEDMKVGLITRCSICYDPCKLTFCDRGLSGGFRSQRMLGVPQILRRFLV